MNTPNEAMQAVCKALNVPEPLPTVIVLTNSEEDRAKKIGLLRYNHHGRCVDAMNGDLVVSVGQFFVIVKFVLRELPSM